MSEEIEQIEQVENGNDFETKSVKKSSSKNMDFGGLEFFYEKNKKAITYGGGALLAIVAIFSFYKFYWLPGEEKTASNEAFFAQTYFEKDSFLVALNGGLNVQTADGPKTMMGFKDIADNYGATKTGSLANYYAGICLLRTGKFEEAIGYLEQYDVKDEMVAPVAIGAIGDANMELNKVDEAIKFYLKAADQSTNSFTTPIYLKKAAFAYEQKANYTEALATYERLKNEYSKSSEARDVDKYIARVKTLGNIQ
ncbi:MAG: tetratricopeptide repeat protein [Burkholderiales bacterium]|nr:tetratricopeptide repeat protein [Bacteroidia bacterium]